MSYFLVAQLLSFVSVLTQVWRACRATIEKKLFQRVCLQGSKRPKAAEERCRQANQKVVVQSSETNR